MAGNCRPGHTVVILIMPHVTISRGALQRTRTRSRRARRSEAWRKARRAVITPELLAALAQVEGSGNPVARTYWRWRLSWNPFEVYRLTACRLAAISGNPHQVSREKRRSGDRADASTLRD